MKSDATHTRERRRERNLGAILDAAREIVLERGPANLSLRETARRADYSPAALYRYFANKDQLLAALGMDAVTVLGHHIEGVDATLPPRERLVALGEAYIAFADQHPEQFELLDRLQLPATTWERYVEVARPFTLIVGAVSEAMAAGAIAAGDAGAAALGLWALAHGFAALRAGHLRVVEAPHAQLRRTAFETYVRGLEEGVAR